MASAVVQRGSRAENRPSSQRPVNATTMRMIEPAVIAPVESLDPKLSCVVDEK